jgi:hypothetical protein
MRKRLTAPFLVFVLLAISTLPFNGCTGFLDFRGYAYEWTNAPSGSTSVIIQADTLPEGAEVRPLSGVMVDANDEDQSHPFQMVSNPDGEFHKALTVELREDIIVNVNQPGYDRASLQFEVSKNKYFYSLIVLLVPKK